MSGSIYHYTHRTQLADILRAGAIEARTHSHWLNPHGVPPLAWCSSAALWEPVCSATLVIGPDAVLPINTVPGRAYEAARVRISPDAAEAWDIAMAKCGAHWSTIMRLAQTGYEQNSDPRRWLASRHPIPARMWIGVDLWDGECWVRIPCQNEQCIMSGIDHFTISKWVGQKGTRMIDTVYGHITPDYSAVEMAKLRVVPDKPSTCSPAVSAADTKVKHACADGIEARDVNDKTALSQVM